MYHPARPHHEQIAKHKSDGEADAGVESTASETREQSIFRACMMLWSLHILQTITWTSYSSILHILICRASATLGNKWISRGQQVCCLRAHALHLPPPCMIMIIDDQLARPGSVVCGLRACTNASASPLSCWLQQIHRAWHRPCTYVLQRPNQCVWSSNHCGV
jgi:hypothetical protein